MTFMFKNILAIVVVILFKLFVSWTAYIILLWIYPNSPEWLVICIVTFCFIYI